MSNLCLTVDEIIEITGRVKPSAQLSALASMRIPARLRPNNTVCVFRSAIEPNQPRRKKDDDVQPDFGAITRGSTSKNHSKQDNTRGENNE